MNDFSPNLTNSSLSRADIFSRTELLLGKDAMERLERAHVAVFGIGGVGGHAAEALARCGVGALTLVDNDTVSVSNLNRQILALTDTLGKYKTDVFKERLLSINPALSVFCHKTFVTQDNIGEFDFSSFDFVIDAVDTVSAKIALILAAKAANVPIISSMGTGNKIDPTALRITDIYKTSVCPLARVMRHEMRKRKVDALPVLASEETPITPKTSLSEGENDMEYRKQPPGSIAFVPAVAGLLISSYVVKGLLDA